LRNLIAAVERVDPLVVSCRVAAVNGLLIEARGGLTRLSIGARTEVERRGVLLPAVNATCTYHSPAHVDDLLDVAMWTDHVGRSSFGFGYQVRRVAEAATDSGAEGSAAEEAPAHAAAPRGGASAGAPGTLIASGSTRHAVVARDTMRPVRIEGWIADLVARAQEWRPPS